MEKEHLNPPKKATCPWCATTAKITWHTDWNRYDCPTCGGIEIGATAEAECRANPAAAQAQRTYIAGQRKRGITISRIGLRHPPA
jgi:ribosomal protein S27AE